MPRKTVPNYEGDGIVDWLQGYKPGQKELEDLLKKHGSSTIFDMYVVRKPVNELLRKGADLLSLGAVSKLPYYKLYHLSLSIGLNDGHKFRLEKVAKVSVLGQAAITPAEEYMKVFLNGSLRLDDFIQRALQKMGKERFYDYNAATNNCQVFIATLLECSRLMTDQLKRFVLQDLSSIEGKTGLLDSIRNTAGSFTQLVGGEIKNISSSPNQKQMPPKKKMLYDEALDRMKHGQKVDLKNTVIEMRGMGGFDKPMPNTAQPSLRGYRPDAISAFLRKAPVRRGDVVVMAGSTSLPPSAPKKVGEGMKKRRKL